MLTPNEIKQRAYAFMKDWEGETSERSWAQTFWNQFFNIWGMSPRRVGRFEKHVDTNRPGGGFIDLFWPGTLLVEHKTTGQDLDAAFRQALNYIDGLEDAELPRYILVCDFQSFHLYDGDQHWERVSSFMLDQLVNHLQEFDFMLGRERREYREEDPVNIEVAELMGKLHDELKEVGYEGHRLELLLVRIMFIFFADDTGIFNAKDHFLYYIESKTAEDGSDLGRTLAEIFEILNTPYDDRMRNLDPDLDQFVYLNGKLFEEHTQMAVFSRDMRTALLEAARYDWGKVSPAIFGSMFQSVMNADLRRNLGAHYTSEKNILKAVNGLFMDDLRGRFEKSKNRAGDLRRLLTEIRQISVFDPACGCGNFLIISYRELRHLELDIELRLRELRGEDPQQQSIDVTADIAQINVDQMYGIEIEEFPSQVAQVALWIMDHIMNTELSQRFGMHYARIPLTTSPNIACANALRMDWEVFAPKDKVKYVVGNPPFVGAKYMSDQQRQDIAVVCASIKNKGLLDYVTAWYLKASEYLRGTDTRSAFVSTNSITQGEQVGTLWGELLRRGLSIDFAHRTFKWKNAAKGVAGVHCVIIGFSYADVSPKYLYDYPDVSGEPVRNIVSTINPYLVDAPTLLITRRSKPLCGVPPMETGNKPIDNGNYLFTPEEKEAFITTEPASEPYFRRWIGGDEFINGTERYCLFLQDVPPATLKSMPKVLERVNAVRRYRAASKSPPTQALAEKPTAFHTSFRADSEYLALPEVSSERRKYIPIAYLTPEYLCSNKLRLVRNADRYLFGVLTSEMHMTWMREVSGRLKSDFTYSAKITYNNFPWPDKPTDKQIARVKDAAQKVLDVRVRYLHQGQNLADMYDPLFMPAELLHAHRTLDRAVDRAYRPQPFTTERNRMKFLFKLYRHYTEGIEIEVADDTK